MNAGFAAVLESQIHVIESLNDIKVHLKVQPAPLTRTISERTLVNPPTFIEHEDQIGSSDEEETLVDDEYSIERPHTPQQSRENGRLLLQAVKDGNTGILDSLLGRSDINLEETDERGKTPLILAADLGKADIISRLLVSESIQINATDNLGRTALHYCAQTKMNKIIEMLLDRSADVDVQDLGSHPPMYYALKEGDCYETVKLLLGHHATTDFERPAKAIPNSIKCLIDGNKTLGSTNPVHGYKSPVLHKSRTNSSGNVTGRRKSSMIPWKSTEK